MSESLKNLRGKARDYYKSIGSVYCPYFDEEITFNSNGFNHLRYRGERKERHFAVQKSRYKLLDFAPKVIGASSTLQEFEAKPGIKFFGFIAILNQWKVKVIVRQIGDGKRHFWSVIPNWKTRPTKDGHTLVHHTGNLLKD